MADSSNDNVDRLKAETQKFKSLLETRGIEGLRKEIRYNLDTLNNTKVNVAVTGESGAGKSTFINALLGLDEGSDKAAPTGITETTMDISKYSKENSNVTFVDLPGVGTRNFPRETYIEKTKLKDYDFFILISCNRFTENDAWLASQIHKLGKNYYFVRSHVDQDIRNYCKRHKKSADKEKWVEKIRNDCEQNLKEISEGTIQVYLIDSFVCDSYDFNILAQALVRNTGGVKANLLVASLSSVTQEIIDMKCNGLIERILFVAYQAGMGCTPATAEGRMKEVFDHESKYYREVFEIDDDTLKTDQDLLSLSGLDSFMAKVMLEKLSKRFIHFRVRTVSETMRHFSEKFALELDELKIKQHSFVEIIFQMLYMYMQCMYQFASSRFQNLPLQYAELCEAQSALKL